jgi:hypothetical protein
VAGYYSATQRHNCRRSTGPLLHRGLQRVQNGRIRLINLVSVQGSRPAASPTKWRVGSEHRLRSITILSGRIRASAASHRWSLQSAPIRGITGLIPCRRATAEILAPGRAASATIACFSASLHCRRVSAITEYRREKLSLDIVMAPALSGSIGANKSCILLNVQGGPRRVLTPAVPGGEADGSQTRWAEAGARHQVLSRIFRGGLKRSVRC